VTYVRRAVAADIDQLLPLCRAFHAESPHHRLLAFSDARVAELLHNVIGQSLSNWLPLVACSDDGEIVGMALFYAVPAFFSDEIEVGELTFWVDPDYRGSRAAHQMLNDVVKWAVQRSAARLQIGVTTGINHDQVLRFLARFGFESRGTLMVKQPVN
jgi:GNAT superfamily N-acetyltransferase